MLLKLRKQNKTKKNYKLYFWSNKAAPLNINVLNGKMFRDLRLATSEDKRMRWGANTTEFLAPKVQRQQIRDVAWRHSLLKCLASCLRALIAHCLMHNETVPVTAADALFLHDKTAETKPINQGVPKPRSAGRFYAAADTFVNDVMSPKNYTILFTATHTA
jgi:hypothetical protein